MSKTSQIVLQLCVYFTANLYLKLNCEIVIVTGRYVLTYGHGCSF